MRYSRLFSMMLFGLALASVPAFGAPCTIGGTLDQYISLGSAGCEAGQYRYSHFDWLVGITNLNANNVLPQNIVVTPSEDPSGPSITFSADWGTNENILPSSYTATLFFRIISMEPTEKLLSTTNLEIEGSRQGLLSVVSVAEVNCNGGLLGPGGTLCLGGGIDVGATAALTGAATTASAQLLGGGPVALIDVVKNLTLTSTGSFLSPASASLNTITQSFGAVDAAGVPEPGSAALVLSSLVAELALVRRNRKLRARSGKE